LIVDSLVLASASPRRRAILHRLGLDFEVIAPGGDGPEVAGSPRNQVLGYARWKAEVVHKEQADRVVLAADTLVFLDESALGKPSNKEQARLMLESLFGRTHKVWTGACLISQSGSVFETADCAVVEFDIPDKEDFGDYLDGNEWADKAGAYGIQGWASRWARVVEGEEETVIGLSSKAVVALLAKLTLAP